MRFDETDRIKELIAQIRTRKENSITGSGHSLAMQASASGMSPVAQLNHKTRGLASIIFIKELDASIQSDESALNHLCQVFQAIHNKLKSAPAQFLLVCEEDAYQSCCDDILQQWATAKLKTIDSDSAHFLNFDVIKEHVKQAWLTSHSG